MAGKRTKQHHRLEKKFAVLSEQVKIKSEQLEKSEEPNDSNVTKKFKDRLTRYYKFFEYRKQKLAAMRQPENKSTKAYKEELKEIIYDNIIDIYKLIDKTHRDIFQPKNLNN